MSKPKNDFLNLVVNINANEAQQKINDLTKANKELAHANKERAAKMRELEMLGKRNSTEYKRLSAVYKEVSTEMSKNSTEIDKQKRSLDLTQLSYSQLKQEAKKLRAQLDATSKSLQPKEWGELNTRLKSVHSQMDKVSASAKAMDDTLCGAVKRAVKYQFTIQGAVAAFIALYRKTRDFITEGIRLAGVAQGIDDAFSKIANKDYLSNLREQTHGLLDDTLLKKYTVQARNLGIPIEHMGKLLAFAQQRAKDTGESVDYMAGSIVTGLGRKSVMILDNLGLSAARISDEFKKTGDFSAAVSKIIDEEMARAGDSIDTSAEAATRASVHWKNLQVQVGGYFVGLKSNIDGISGWLARMIGSSLGYIHKHWSNVKVVLSALITGITVYTAYVYKAIVAEKIQLLLTASRRKAVVSLSLVYSLLTGNIAKANRAMAILNITMTKNPAGLLLAVISALGAAFVGLYLRSSAVTEQQNALSRVAKKTSEDFSSQAAEVEVLTKTIENNSISVTKRREAIAELKQIMPEYNGYISEEGVLYNHNTEAISAYLVQLEKEIKLKAIKEELEDLYRRKYLADKEKAAAESVMSKSPYQSMDARIQPTYKQSMKWARTVNARANSQKIDDAITALKREYTAAGVVSNSTTDSVKGLLEVQEELLEQAKLMPETTEIEIAAKNKKIEVIEKEIDRLKSLGRTGKATVDATVKTEKDRISAVKDATAEEIRLFEESQTRIRLEAKKQLADGKMTAETYASVVATTEKASADFRLEQYLELYRSLENLEVKNGKDKKRALDEASTAILKAEEDVIDKRIALNASLAAIAEKAWQEVQKKQKAAREKADLDKEAGKAPDEMRQQFGLVDTEFENKMKLAALDEYYKQALEKYKDNEQVKQELAAVYAQAKAKIEIDAEAEKLRTIADMGFAGQLAAFAQELVTLREQHQKGLLEEQQYQQKKAELRKRFAEFSVKAVTEIASTAAGYMQEQEMIAVDQKYASEIAAAQGNQEKLREIEEKKEAEKLAIQKKYADINFIIRAAEIMANTAVAVMRAMAELGPIAGPIAAVAMSAAGAVQLAIANQERQKVKVAQPGGSGGSASTAAGMPVRVASGRESGGYIDVEREQDGKRFRALHEPRKRGYVDRPTVIVGDGPAGRSREWVASNDALSNPTIAPIIQLLDAAQLSGQIRTIDMSTVIRNRYVGHEGGGYIQPAGGSESQSVLTPLVGGGARDERTIRVLEKFIDTLDRTGKEGIRASIVYSELERKRKTKERSEEAARKK